MNLKIIKESENKLSSLNTRIGIIFITFFCSLFVLNDGLIAQISFFPDIPPSSGTRYTYGASMSASEDYLVVGQPVYWDSTLNLNTGTVFMYRQSDDGTWEDHQQFLPYETILVDSLFDYDIIPALNWNFGGYGHSVDIDNENLAISYTWYNDYTHCGYKGAVYVYEEDDNNNWGNVQKISASDMNLGDGFGCSLSIEDNKLVVASVSHPDSQPPYAYFVSGTICAYIYEKDSNGVWGNEKKITIGVPNEYYYFVPTVKIFQEKIYINYKDIDDSDFTVSGALYIYSENDQGEWVNEQTILSPSPSPSQGQHFGAHFDVNEDHLIISRAIDISSNSEASIFFYEKNSNGEWIFKQEMNFGASQDFNYYLIESEPMLYGDKVLSSGIAINDIPYGLDEDFEEFASQFGWPHLVYEINMDNTGSWDSEIIRSTVFSNQEIWHLTSGILTSAGENVFLSVGEHYWLDSSSGDEPYDGVVLPINWEPNKFIDAFTYWDINQNGIQDGEEPRIEANQLMTVSPDTLIASPLNEYNHMFRVDVGEYEVSINPNGNHIISSVNPVNINIEEQSFITEVAFGLYFDEIHHDIEAILTSAATRCNTQVPFWLSVLNQGTDYASGMISLELDEEVSLISASPMPEVNGNLLEWNYEDLLPYKNEAIELILQMPDVDQVGAALLFDYQVIQVDDGGLILSEDSGTYSSILTCAYDPNDKLVSEDSLFYTDYITEGSRLEYTIRFQNTGNAEAYNIRLDDQLADYYDWESFELLQTSHFAYSEIDSLGMLSIYFDNINLPDSSSNWIESHGYAHFSLDLREGFSPDQLIENDAAIYFDFNPPIMTNTVSTHFDLTGYCNLDIDCPEDFSIDLEPGTCEALVSYALPIAMTTNDSFCFPDITIVEGLLPGTYAQVGTYSQIFVATDLLGEENICSFDITINESTNPVDNLICKESTVAIIDEEDCTTITPDMILVDGSNGCDEYYIVEVDSFGNEVCCEAIGLTLEAVLTDPETGNTCSTTIYTEDEVAPSCEAVTNYTILCGESLPSVDDSSHPGFPQFSDNCGIDNVILTSQVNSGDICNDGLTIIRVWAATDNQGNLSSSNCVQEILVEREQPIFPESVNFSCSQYTAEDMTPDITGWPTGIEEGCFFWASYSDVFLPGCPMFQGKIVRTWTILDMCSNEVFTDIQLIDLTDSDGPSIDAVPLTLSANIDQCFFTGFIDAPVILEECSGLESVEMFIEGVTEVSYEYDDSGIIIGINVEGDGMEVGTHILSIIATDECGNMSSKEIDLTVVDNIAPTMVCLEDPSIVLTEVNGSAQAIISVDDIVLEAIDCSDDLTFSFSEDMSLTELAFDCQDLGNVEIVAWVTDESNLTGNCNVTLTVEDPDNLCDFTSANELKVFNNTVLYQNAPNPVSGSTTIGFELSEASTVQLTIVDINGVVVKQISGTFGEGYNSVFIERIDRRGVLFYTLETNNFMATKKMVIKD